MKTILVFRTSVSTDGNARRVAPLLNKLMGSGEKWNFDLEDCDHILRVEAVSLQAQTVIRDLGRAGFFCEELED